MDEQLLQRIALLVVLTGFVGLGLLFFLQIPQKIGTQALPEETLLEFSTTINQVYHTATGAVVVFSREQSGFIDGNVSEDIVGQSVIITGRWDGDFFQVQRLAEQ